MLHTPSALMKGVSRDDPTNGARAVPAGEARNFAPGRLRASSRPTLRSVCEVLAALAPGRVLPFAPGNSRKRGPELSQSLRAFGERRGGAPRGERSPLGSLPRPPARLQDIAPTGAPLPSLCLEGNFRTSVAELGCQNASRERDSIPLPPTRVSAWWGGWGHLAEGT
jgi:hypothetical protein